MVVCKWEQVVVEVFRILELVVGEPPEVYRLEREEGVASCK